MTLEETHRALTVIREALDRLDVDNIASIQMSSTRPLTNIDGHLVQTGLKTMVIHVEFKMPSNPLIGGKK